MSIVQCAYPSAVGMIYAVASEKGLQHLSFSKQDAPLIPLTQNTSLEAKHLAEVINQLGEYFQGQRKTFDVALDLKGTDFELKVWRQLMAIPFGQTRAYKDIAIAIGNPKAMRAVGRANGKNPVCILIPCHRVIALNGTLGGYSQGLPIKRKLLNLESM